MTMKEREGGKEEKSPGSDSYEVKALVYNLDFKNQHPGRENEEVESHTSLLLDYLNRFCRRRKRGKERESTLLRPALSPFILDLAPAEKERKGRGKREEKEPRTVKRQRNNPLHVAEGAFQPCPEEGEGKGGRRKEKNLSATLYIVYLILLPYETIRNSKV